jgi:hypothetical protein
MLLKSFDYRKLPTIIKEVLYKDKAVARMKLIPENSDYFKHLPEDELGLIRTKNATGIITTELSPISRMLLSFVTHTQLPVFTIIVALPIDFMLQTGTDHIMVIILSELLIMYAFAVVLSVPGTIITYFLKKIEPPIHETRINFNPFSLKID